jgi:hypothetical protein
VYGKQIAESLWDEKERKFPFAVMRVEPTISVLLITGSKFNTNNTNAIEVVCQRQLRKSPKSIRRIILAKRIHNELRGFV